MQFCIVCSGSLNGSTTNSSIFFAAGVARGIWAPWTSGALGFWSLSQTPLVAGGATKSLRAMSPWSLAPGRFPRCFLERHSFQCIIRQHHDILINYPFVRRLSLNPQKHPPVPAKSAPRYCARSIRAAALGCGWSAVAWRAARWRRCGWRLSWWPLMMPQRETWAILFLWVFCGCFCCFCGLWVVFLGVEGVVLCGD